MGDRRIFEEGCRGDVWLRENTSWSGGRYESRNVFYLSDIDGRIDVSHPRDSFRAGEKEDRESLCPRVFDVYSVRGSDGDDDPGNPVCDGLALVGRRRPHRRRRYESDRLRPHARSRGSVRKRLRYGMADEYDVTSCPVVH